MGNAHQGVVVASPTTAVIGGASAAARNIISNNVADGMDVRDVGTSLTIEGNYIGTDLTGSVAMGNGGAGVSAFGPNIIIGGTAAGAGNVVANNGFKATGFAEGGISVWVSPVTILSNSIYNNSPLGIILAGNAANKGQAAPTLMSVNGTASTVIMRILTGTANTAYTIQFFSNTAASFMGFAEGQTFLGSASAMTNGSASATIDTTLPVAVPIGLLVDATATDAAGNTSQFSAAIAAGSTLTPLRVDGVGHLRNGVSSITIDFDEALNPESAESPRFYSVFGGVKHRKKTVYTKPVRIRGIALGGTMRVTVYLAKPYKGSAEIIVRPGIEAADGAETTSTFVAIVK
jgi:hypothetical protein